MWVEVKRTRLLVFAEMWKECFEGEGIPARIMPAQGLPIGQEIAEYVILVPEDKEHVIRDILRKL
ncbi:MAG: hypothetical protein N2506_01640 [Dehalococcoidales bacterium]|nr:hypothetical protein [Dehalococcoidales bacterium]